MRPVKFEAADERIGEIPVNKARGIILSRWKATWRERISILFYGMIWLSVVGDTMQPTLVSGDREFRIENPPNSRCSRRLRRE